MEKTTNIKLLGESKFKKYYANDEGQLFVESKSTGETKEVIPGCTSDGYPVIRIGKKNYYVHRLVIQTFTGKEIPKGMHVDHVYCDKKNFSLSNLEVITHQENLRRAMRNGLINTRKLEYDTAEEIREVYKTGEYSQRKLGEMYSVSQQTISNIINFRRYSFN